MGKKKMPKVGWTNNYPCAEKKKINKYFQEFSACGFSLGSGPFLFNLTILKPHGKHHLLCTTYKRSYSDASGQSLLQCNYITGS